MAANDTFDSFVSHAVVLDTKGSIVYLGTLAEVTPVGFVLTDADVHVIDSLSAAHYSGEWTMYDRPGHISTAINISIFQLFDESGQFLFAANPETDALLAWWIDTATGEPFELPGSPFPVDGVGARWVAVVSAPE